MGDFDPETSVFGESPLRYHPQFVGILTQHCLPSLRTESGGQFDWGGRLLKGNGGAQRFSQHGRKSCVERNRIRELDCEADGPSRDESRR